MENKLWFWQYRGEDVPEQHRPHMATDGHFRVFFREVGEAIKYINFQNAKEQ